MSPQKSSVQDAAQEYFSKINPIASRIYADFEETKNSYECVWKTLSFEEQSQILNECIIKPEVTLQYNLKPSAFSDKPKNSPKSESFAHKRVVDENVSYRDEHSAPFSFKTLSQVDLRLFGSDTSKKVLVTPKLEAPKILPPSCQQPQPPPINRYSNSLLGKLLCRGAQAQFSARDFAVGGYAEEHEALVSPQSPDTATTDTTDTLADEDTFGGDELPKTGLDFLDNW